MGRTAKLQGYTILEVMIFMAVSGFMFLIAATFVSGKQANAEFRQSTNDFNSQIKAVINDVNNGFYPSTNNFICQSNAAGPDFFVPNAQFNGEQGTNQGCTYIGKVIQFGTAGTAGAGYNVYSIAGLQFSGGGNSGVPPTSFTDAKPAVVKKGGVVDLTDNETLGYGMKVTKACLWDAAQNQCGITINGIGFFGSFSGFDSATNTLESGSQTTVMIPFKGNLDMNPAAFLNSEVKNGILDSEVVSNPDVRICLDNGSKQTAALIIGGDNGQRLTTSIKIDTAANLGCS
jgi:type II secretory pathway pseudopilin PulG